MSYGLPDEGTRRLRASLGALALGACFIAAILILFLHGAPFWIGWWIVMLAVLAGSFFAGRALTPLFEWILAGYLVK